MANKSRGQLKDELLKLGIKEGERYNDETSYNDLKEMLEKAELEKEKKDKPKEKEENSIIIASGNRLERVYSFEDHGEDFEEKAKKLVSKYVIKDENGNDKDQFRVVERESIKNINVKYTGVFKKKRKDFDIDFSNSLTDIKKAIQLAKEKSVRAIFS